MKQFKNPFSFFLFTMWGYLTILIIIVAIILILGFFWWGIKRALFLAINSVIGFFALYAVQAWWLKDLVINFWSVILTAILGLLGLITVVVLHLIGLAF